MIENINLDEIQKVYFGLKTDDVTYISQSKGNDFYDGLSTTKPKKNLVTNNIDTKYIVILDGHYSFLADSARLSTIKDKIIIGRNSFIFDEDGNYSKSNVSINFEYKQNGYLKGINTVFVNLEFSPAAHTMYYSDYIFYNCFLNLDSRVSSQNSLTATNCVIKSTDFFSNPATLNNCIYDIASGGGHVLNNTLKDDYMVGLKRPVPVELKNTGIEDIKNPDGTRSNIGINGGPYYFDGFKENVKGDSIDVEISTETNSVNFILNNVKINSDIVNLGNLRQRILKQNDTELEQILEKEIVVSLSQTKGKRISFYEE